jgi:integrase/recombinase XerD
MFEQLFERPHALARQRNGPLAGERRRYMVHCAEQQMAPRTLRHVACYTLVVAKALRLADLDFPTNGERPDKSVSSS